jgi:hypothetical protein
MTSDPVTNRAARWVPSSGRLAPGTMAHAPIRDTANTLRAVSRHPPCGQASAWPWSASTQ